MEIHIYNLVKIIRNEKKKRTSYGLYRGQCHCKEGKIGLVFYHEQKCKIKGK